MSKNGKYRFYKTMLEDELITEDEFRFLVWYDRHVKQKLDKETK